MAKEEETQEKPQTKSVPWVMIILTVILSLVFVVGTILGTLYFAGVLSGGKDKTQEVATTDGEETVVEEPKAEHSQAIYLPLDPAFVVNFEGKGPARFLQINVEVMTRNPDMEEHIKKHMPAIRNNLVFLFGSQTYDNVATLEGKEKLRSAALEEVKKIMDTEVGDSAIEALYFTSFVMQ